MSLPRHQSRAFRSNPREARGISTSIPHALRAHSYHFINSLHCLRITPYRLSFTNYLSTITHNLSQNLKPNFNLTPLIFQYCFGVVYFHLRIGIIHFCFYCIFNFFHAHHLNKSFHLFFIL